jgi:hypothetical protein
MSIAQDVMTNLLGFADIRINGTRPWDIKVHDRRFFSRVLASGTLGFGESYMDGWWDCDALDEMCCRTIRAGLEKRFAFRLPNVWAEAAFACGFQSMTNFNREFKRIVGRSPTQFREALPKLRCAT